MKAFHRILAILGCLAMLFLGVTGAATQALDLLTIHGGAPEADLTMQSINEGKFGGGGHAVLTPGDFGAEALPAGLDYPASFSVVQAALAKARPGQDPDFVELRMSGNRAIGQGRFGKDVLAFDAISGAQVDPVALKPAQPPRSTRQSLKELHRMWGPSLPWKGNTPYVYVELLFGLVLCALVVTGLVMYFRLFKVRRKIGRPNPFWLAGSLWRVLHRVTSISASVFLVLIALSGTWIGFESTYHSFQQRPPQVDPKPLPAVEVPGMVAATLAALKAHEPDVAVRVIRMREYYGYKHGVVVTSEPVTRQLVFDTANGRPMTLTEPGYPDSRFPLGMDVHEWAKHFHSGYLFGLPARWMSLLAGLALVYLSVSGIVMYFQLWLHRRRTGRGAFFWKG